MIFLYLSFFQLQLSAFFPLILPHSSFFLSRAAHAIVLHMAVGGDARFQDAAKAPGINFSVPVMEEGRLVFEVHGVYERFYYEE